MRDLIITIPVVLICITFHEAAHAYVSYLLGDNTAKLNGRFTLNPIPHIDMLGLLCLICFRVGWAKPVPVNSSNLKKPKRDLALISLAGPMANILLALICLFIIRIIGIFSSNIILAFVSFFQTLSIVSVGLAVFNLLPVPPLDGANIFYYILPRKWVFTIEQYQQFIHFGIIMLLYLGILSRPLNMVRSIVYDFLVNIVF